MKITVVVPSYNQGAYLGATIRSLLDQEYLDLEVLVNDGGSTDNSVEVLRSFGNRIRWRSERDRGQSDAINRGLHEATGEITAYLNSDDVYFPGTLQRVASYFGAHSECGVLYGNASHLHADGSFMEPYPTQPWDYAALFERCYICQPAAFWRRSIHRQLGYFDESLHFSMDYEFWLRVGASQPLHFLDGEPIAGSRLHQDTKTLRQRVPCHEEILCTVKRHATRPSQVYGWLSHLASLRAQHEGSPPSPDPVRHHAHVTAFARHALVYAEQCEIELSDSYLEQIQHLLESSRVGA